MNNLKKVNLNDIDFNNLYFHFTDRNKLEEIASNGLKAQIGDNTKLVNGEARVYLSKGAKAILETKSAFIIQLRELRICDIPDCYREYFDIKDFSSTKKVSEKLLFDALEKKFKDEVYLVVKAEEGEDVILEENIDHYKFGDFESSEERRRDIKCAENHDISPEKLEWLIVENGDSAFDVVQYLYNRLIENAKKSGKTDSVRRILAPLDNMFDYINDRENVR